MANLTVRNLNRVSQLFQPKNIVPKDAVVKSEVISKGHKHLIDNGYIRQTNTGMYALLPLGLRVLEKLTSIIDKEMTNIGAQKIILPALTNSKLWQKTQRYEEAKSELLEVTDRHKKKYILSPTFEEAICDLISDVGPLNHKSLPLKLYQISSKWRDEIKPRHGFLRSKEFIMKDLYTFDKDLQESQKTYNSVCDAYDKIFNLLGVEFVKAEGDMGMVGGIISHEYHYFSEIGDDTILVCPSCKYSVNKNIYNKEKCINCTNEMNSRVAIEVGHTFLLDHKYSKPLNATWAKYSQNEPLTMGCYGLGITRIMTAAAEVLSTNDELRWPLSLVPYNVCLVPPKQGSKEESANQYIEPIYDILKKSNLDAILYDTKDTIGKRLRDAKKIGYPLAIVIGKLATMDVPKFEVIDLYNSEQQEMTLEELRDYLLDNNLPKIKNQAVQ